MFRIYRRNHFVRLALSVPGSFHRISNILLLFPFTILRVLPGKQVRGLNPQTLRGLILDSL